MKVKVAQSFPTLCDPMDGTVHGTLRASILEWVAFPFSRGIFPTQELNWGLLHCRWILRQLSYQEAPKYLCPWHSPGENTGVGGLSLLQGNLPNPGIQPRSPPLQGDSLPAEPQGKPKNTGVGSLSLLQRIFPTPESN